MSEEDQRKLNSMNKAVSTETANVGAVKEYQRHMWKLTANCSAALQFLTTINSQDTELIFTIEAMLAVLPQKTQKAQDWLDVHEARLDRMTADYIDALALAERL